MNKTAKPLQKRNNVNHYAHPFAALLKPNTARIVIRKRHLLPFLFLLAFPQIMFSQRLNEPWSNWEYHPCFAGLAVSTKNMGYNNDNKAYYWGVRIRNDYPKAVTFSYLFSVGGEKDNAEKTVYQPTRVLKPGEIWTEGADPFTAIMFKSSSPSWRLKIIDVCFEGMNCGGANNCYAGCDVVDKKINQPCGMEGAQEKRTPNQNNGTAGQEQINNSSLIEGEYMSEGGSANSGVLLYKYTAADYKGPELWFMDDNGKYYQFSKQKGDYYAEENGVWYRLKIKGQGKLCRQTLTEELTVKSEQCFNLVSADDYNKDNFKSGSYTSEIDKKTTIKIEKTIGGLVLLTEGIKFRFQKNSTGVYENLQSDGVKIKITNTGPDKLCYIEERNGVKTDNGCFAYSGGPIKETAPVVGGNSSFSGIWMYSYSLDEYRSVPKYYRDSKVGTKIKFEIVGDEIIGYTYPSLIPWTTFNMQGKEVIAHFYKVPQTQYYDVASNTIKTAKVIYQELQNYKTSCEHYCSKMSKWLKGCGSVQAIIFTTDDKMTLNLFCCSSMYSNWGAGAGNDFYTKISD